MNIETIIIDKDIKVFYIAAASFPDGVMAAFDKLYKIAPPSEHRIYYGISRPENGGGIQYKAATEETHEGEGAQNGCQALVLKKGSYLCITIKDFMKDLAAIGLAFQTLLSQPGLDPEGYCVEEYFNDKDVRCMIRLGGS